MIADRVRGHRQGRKWSSQIPLTGACEIKQRAL